MAKQLSGNDSKIISFVTESNKIEGILRFPTPDERWATAEFLEKTAITVSDIESLVSELQPDAILRRTSNLNVRVGGHIAPQGGPEIEPDLKRTIRAAINNTSHPYVVHQRYETLHPFTDGNGRSGRALWAWQMLHHGYSPGIDLGFLHAWYYQSLQHANCRKSLEKLDA